jgi:hypothetical protein
LIVAPDITHRKLVAADPNDQIIRAQMTADPIHCALQQCVTRGMTSRVVDGLQANDVDVGNHQRVSGTWAVCSCCTWIAPFFDGTG